MSYFLGYMLGLEARSPKRETFGHRIALLRDRIRRYIKNWRYHFMRKKKLLSPEAIARIREMAQGFEDGYKAREQ